MKNIILSALYLLILFCVSEFFLEPSNLYYEFKWLDIPMHLLGGFGVAALTAGILKYTKHPVSFAKVVAVYLLIAVMWEAYEYIHDLVRMVVWNGWIDTTKDVFMGGVGASIAYTLMKK